MAGQHHGGGDQADQPAHAGQVAGTGALQGLCCLAPHHVLLQASAPCKLWSLTAIRFTELTNRQPAIALGLAMAAGAVLAKRLGNRRRRVAAT
jgi:hypothetical protein